MKLAEHEVELVEELLNHEGWKIVERMLDERIRDRQTQVFTGRCKTFDEYKAACESIREAVYLRDRPMQMIREARSHR